MGQSLDNSENFDCQETMVNIGKRVREKINKYRIWREEPGSDHRNGRESGLGVAMVLEKER